MAGQTLHLILKVENRDDGAHATLTSVDQGGVEIPVTSISQKDAKVTLEVKNVGGHFEGDLKNATELDGTWSQNGNDMPLKLKGRKRTEGLTPPRTFSNASAISSSFTTVFQLRAVPGVAICFSIAGTGSFERPMPSGRR